MRNAPSVTYPAGRCFMFGLVLLLTSALAALALALWWWLYPARPKVQTIFGGLAWLCWSGFACRAWLRQPIGQLQWAASATRTKTEGHGVWYWTAQGAPPCELQRVQWTWDTQTVVLLHLQATGQRPFWLWLQVQDDRARWVDLRRALTVHM